jgi:hypothetical protein
VTAHSIERDEREREREEEATHQARLRTDIEILLKTSHLTQIKRNKTKQTTTTKKNT